MTGPAPERIERIAGELMGLLGTVAQVAPYSAREGGFGLPAAYAVVARVRALREARGERPVGRKIGFTNRAIWGTLGISAPVWNYVYDSTLHAQGAAEASVAAMPEPRIEPEVALHLARAPEPGMSVAELAACVDWIAPAFELVTSVFPGWRFTAADAAAAFGVHGALVLGDRLALTERLRRDSAELTGFTVELAEAGGESRSGHASNVLGGPLHALQFLVEEIARTGAPETLAAGEVVTTGTLTEALPVAPGERWSMRFEGIDLAPMTLAIR